MLISVIIPVYNEEAALGKLIPHIRERAGSTPIEIIISDGGSTDNSCIVAQNLGAIVIKKAFLNRARQLNAGAEAAKGDLLYFLHADSSLPSPFADIIRSFYEKKNGAGCFRLTFDHQHWLINFSSWLTRFNMKSYQFGDQSFYVSRNIFNRLNGYDESLLIMEDIDIVDRARKFTSLVIMPHNIITSARKYLKHGVIKTEWTHIIVYFMFLLRMDQQRIVRVYKKMLS